MENPRTGKSLWRRLVKKYGVLGAAARYRRSFAANAWYGDTEGHRRAALIGWARKKGRPSSAARRRYAMAAMRRYGIPAKLLMAANPPKLRRRRLRRNPPLTPVVTHVREAFSLENLPYAALGGVSIVSTWWLSNRLLRLIGLTDKGLIGLIGNIATAGLLSGATAIVTRDAKIVGAVATGGLAGATARFLVETLLMPQRIGGITLTFEPPRPAARGLGEADVEEDIRARIQEAVRQQIAEQAGVAGWLPAEEAENAGVSGWIPAEEAAPAEPEQLGQADEGVDDEFTV